MWLTGKTINGIKVERIDAHPTNYSEAKYRTGYGLYVNHWMAGRIDSAISRFTSPNAGGSAHFSVSDNRIVQHMPLDCVAWTNGNWDANTLAISAELEGGWAVTGDAQEQRAKPTEKVHENAAYLMAEVANFLKQALGTEYVDGDYYRLNNLKNLNVNNPGLAVMEHRELSATMCPGTTDTVWIMNTANAIRAGKYKAQPTVNPDQVRIKDLESQNATLHTKLNEKDSQISSLELAQANMKAEMKSLNEKIDILTHQTPPAPSQPDKETGSETEGRGVSVEQLNKLNTPIKQVAEAWNLQKRLVGLSKHNIDVAAIAVTVIATVQSVAVFKPEYLDLANWVSTVIGIVTGVSVAGGTGGQIVKKLQE